MKTKTNKQTAVKTAVLLLVLLGIGSVASAQAREERPTPVQLRECLGRLEMIMQATEESVRYCASSAEAQECCAAVKRLEMIASLTEQQIKYVPPREESDILPDVPANDPDQERWLANEPVHHQPD